MKQASGRSTEAGINSDLFEMDAHLQECNHASSDCWRSEPLYAARPRRYLAHTAPQPGVETYARNVGHGQHANGSREAPDGNEGRCGSTLRQPNAIMGGLKYKEGKMRATHGNGSGDDWETVLEMCACEIGLKALALSLHTGNITTFLVDGPIKMMSSEALALSLHTGKTTTISVSRLQTLACSMHHGIFGIIRRSPFWVDRSRTRIYGVVIVCPNCGLAHAKSQHIGATTKLLLPRVSVRGI